MNRESSPCLFCAIATDAAPSHSVYGDDQLYAFLDIHPIRPGHTQIIPREHYPYFDDLPPDLAAAMIRLGQQLAAVMKSMYRVERVGFAFTGADVAHTHAHVVPLVDQYDITSRSYIVEEDVTFRLPPRAPDAELRDSAARLRGSLQS